MRSGPAARAARARATPSVDRRSARRRSAAGRRGSAGSAAAAPGRSARRRASASRPRGLPRSRRSSSPTSWSRGPSAPRAGRSRRRRSSGDDDQQQDEGRRVGLLRRVALARGRVVVDVARQRPAGARAARSRPGNEPWGSSCSVAPSSTTTIAVSPAIRPIPSAAPVEMFGAPTAAGRGGSSRSSSCRAPRTPRARARGRDCRPSRVAAEDHRQRDQRHHRAGGQERAPEDGAALGGEGQQPRRCPAGRAPARRSRSRCRACRR